MPGAATAIARGPGKRGCRRWRTRPVWRFVSPLSPGTSKWNKIEHRLFCHITQNWRGTPLRTFQTIVETIGHTRTAAGLRVKAKLDKAKYPTGVVVTRAQMKELALHRHEFHGEWNYELRPRRT